MEITRRGTFSGKVLCAKTRAATTQTSCFKPADDMPPTPGGRLNAGKFYEEYHGHQIGHLQKLHSQLKQDGAESFIFLAGDSSLDNKHWFFEDSQAKRDQMNDPRFTAAALNGYDAHLKPQRMVMDVAYWMNSVASERFGSGKVVCLNGAIEESTVQLREDDGLQPQDEFVRDNVGPEDSIVLSLGGNDIALRPTSATIFNMALLTRLPNAWLLNKTGWAPGFAHFEGLFRVRIEAILRKLVAKTAPKKIIVCMIYYPNQVPGGSWADQTLSLLGYDTDPSKLQLIIRSVFKAMAAKGFDVPGTEVEAYPLFEVMDGTIEADYEQRVEPSVQGGQKMAGGLLRALFGGDGK
jgi:hypothetical protein